MEYGTVKDCGFGLLDIANVPIIGGRVIAKSPSEDVLHNWGLTMMKQMKKEYTITAKRISRHLSPIYDIHTCSDLQNIDSIIDQLPLAFIRFLHLNWL